MLKNLLSQKHRNTIRRVVDRCQYKPLSDAVVLGGSAQWCLRTDPLRGKATPIMISGGVGNDISFELEFIEKFGGKVFIYDPSPTGRKTIAELGLTSSLHYTPAAIAGNEGKVAMARPLSMAEGSWTALPNGAVEIDELPSTTIDNEMERYQLTAIDVLKLDIEGFEYEVLHSVLSNRSLPKQILVEFHDFLPGISREKTQRSLSALRNRGYVCFYKQRHEYSFFLPD